MREKLLLTDLYASLNVFHNFNSSSVNNFPSTSGLLTFFRAFLFFSEKMIISCGKNDSENVWDVEMMRHYLIGQMSHNCNTFIVCALFTIMINFLIYLTDICILIYVYRKSLKWFVCCEFT